MKNRKTYSYFKTW